MSEAAPICPICQTADYSAWGDMPCMCAYEDDALGPAIEEPGPTQEELCEE